MKKKTWGQTLSLDLSGCPKKILTDPKKLGQYCLELCQVIKMEPHGKPLFQRFGDGYLEGYSGVQFIETSSITVHADEVDNRVFIDIFTCKKFNKNDGVKFTREFFQPQKMKYRNFYRE